MSKNSEKVFTKKDHTTSFLQGVKLKTKPRGENQANFVKSIEENEIIFCTGPAGAGKSVLSLVKALKLLKDPKTQYNELVLITPAVESDEELGFMPGDLNDKLYQFLYSSFYLLEQLVGEETLKRLRQANIIRVVGLGFITGMNIDNSILVFEEAQNCTIKQMKRLLTRIGHNSKFIISGDVEQTDRFDDIEKSGLYYAINNLKGKITGVAVCEFEHKDIVRNPIIGKILDHYDG